MLMLNFQNIKLNFILIQGIFILHMGLNNSLFGYENFKKLLEEVENFLNEHLPNKFISIFPPKLIYSTKWKHDYIIRKKNG